jgi:rhamnogalacturonyl hydrolase YesR
MPLSPVRSFSSLKVFCENKEFAGWDPYDGLNSRLFQALPGLSRSRCARLAWIQFFKLSPVNLRRITLVPEEHNSKGLGLFLTGYCYLYKTEPKEEYREKIIHLADKIVGLVSKGYAGACWGYNFDWQARAFFQPKHTPTVVATSFVADALMTAGDTLNDRRWQDVALSSAQFVLQNLNRTYDEKGNFSFSYSPLDKTQVYNASLLGARLLARVYAYTGETVLRDEARKAVAYACDRQRADGAWAYGTLPYHGWVDNFHTGFNLECIHQYQQFTGDNSFQPCLEKGFSYYLENFFTGEGVPKYYDNKTFPIDIHAPAQLMATLYKTGRMEEYRELAERVLDWTIREMQAPRGYFFYQKRRLLSSRINYMRWAQAWMFYAFCCYFASSNCKKWINEL